MPVSDCERLIEEWLAQPVNALSSLAFVLAGIGVPMVARRRSPHLKTLGWVFGFSLVLVGLGSLAFHGPGGVPAGWIHDASITALLILVLIIELGSRAGWDERLMVTCWAISAPALMAVEWVWPGIGDPLNTPLALFTVLGVVWHRQMQRGVRLFSGRAPARSIGTAMVGTGAIVMILSRTGGPLCVPDSLIQGHAIWHVLAAAGIGLYAVSLFPVTHRAPRWQSPKMHV
jgi:hypothetical protein